MGTEGSHATAHHSPLAAGIVVGDFKSKAATKFHREQNDDNPGDLFRQN